MHESLQAARNGSGKPASAGQARSRFAAIVAKQRSREVARLLGCSRSYVDMICAGHRNPGMRTATLIERFFDIPLAGWTDTSTLQQAIGSGRRSQRVKVQTIAESPRGLAAVARARVLFGEAADREGGSRRMATLVGRSVSFVDMLRRGERRPGIRTALVIEALFQIPMRWWSADVTSTTLRRSR